MTARADRLYDTILAHMRGALPVGTLTVAKFDRLVARLDVELRAQVAAALAAQAPPQSTPTPLRGFPDRADAEAKLREIREAHGLRLGAPLRYLDLNGEEVETTLVLHKVKYASWQGGYLPRLEVRSPSGDVDIDARRVLAGPDAINPPQPRRRLSKSIRNRWVDFLLRYGGGEHYGTLARRQEATQAAAAVWEQAADDPEITRKGAKWTASTRSALDALARRAGLTPARKWAAASQRAEYYYRRNLLGMDSDEHWRFYGVQFSEAVRPDLVGAADPIDPALMREAVQAAAVELGQGPSGPKMLDRLIATNPERLRRRLRTDAANRLAKRADVDWFVALNQISRWWMPHLPAILAEARQQLQPPAPAPAPKKRPAPKIRTAKEAEQFTGKVARQLKRLKKDLGVGRISQGYKGTGSQRAARKMRLGSMPADFPEPHMSIWLDGAGWRYGAVAGALRVDGQAVVPRRSYGSLSPEGVYDVVLHDLLTYRDEGRFPSPPPVQRATDPPTLLISSVLREEWEASEEGYRLGEVPRRDAFVAALEAAERQEDGTHRLRLTPAVRDHLLHPTWGIPNTDNYLSTQVRDRDDGPRARRLRRELAVLRAHLEGLDLPTADPATVVGTTLALSVAGDGLSEVAWTTMEALRAADGDPALTAVAVGVHQAHLPALVQQGLVMGLSASQPERAALTEAGERRLMERELTRAGVALKR